MGRFNYRLIFSLLAAGMVLITLLVPTTRPLTQRAFWLLSGSYQAKTNVDLRDYASTQGMYNDYRVALLLRGIGHTSVEARAFDLAVIATQKKSAAMWAHVIRQTSQIPITLPSGAHPAPTDTLRHDAMANLELQAAKEGLKLAPNNSFFSLAEATALGKLGKWNQLLAPLERGAGLSMFDDYTSDILRRQLVQLYKRLDPVLPSDLGGDWSMILMPHLTNYRKLTEGLANIPNESDRLRLGLALARIGRTIQTSQDLPVMRLSGSALVTRSLRAVAGVNGKTEQAPAIPSLLPKLVKESEALGLSNTAKGYTELKNWAPYQPAEPNVQLDSYPIDVYPMGSAHALLALAWITALGILLWLGSQIEVSFSNISKIVGSTLVFSIIGFGMVDMPWLLVGWVWGSTLIFGSFLAGRLPGKQQPAIFSGVAGVAMILAVTFAYGQFSLGFALLLLLAIPFVLSYAVKWTAPRWFVIGLSSLVLGASLTIAVNGFSRSPQSFEENFVGTIQALAIFSMFGLMLLSAYVMALGKLNLSDSLSLLLKPIPLFALIASGWFVLGTREQVQLQNIWSELTQKELPKSYRVILDEVRQEANNWR